MASCYVVKSGAGDTEKGIIDFTSKECISNMVQTWLFAKETGFTTNGYIIFPTARVCGSYNNAKVGISVKFNYPTDFNVLTDIITTYTSSTKTTGYNLNTPSKIKEGNYSYWNKIFNHESVYVSEDVECKYPEIKKHFGEWYDYRDLRYIDVIKYPS